MKIMLKELFKKDTLTGKERKQIKNSERQKNATRNPSVPDGLFSKCDKCGEIICTDDIVENYYICPKCNNYFRIEPRKRISMLIDENTFTETDSNLTMYNPLEFPGYEDKLKSLKKKTNLDEAVVTGFGEICGIKTGIAVMSANFMMGSMGHNVGEKSLNDRKSYCGKTSCSYFMLFRRCANARGNCFLNADGENITGTEKT